MAFTDDDRKAVLETLADEVRAKHEGKPYSEAVIMACEACLRVNARKPSHEPPHYTMPQPEVPEPAQRARYWWQDQD